MTIEDYEALWYQWVPDLEKSAPPRLCTLCCTTPIHGFKDLCQACEDEQNTYEDDMLRKQEVTNFVDTCKYGCSSHYNDVWLVGGVHYHIQRQKHGIYQVNVSSEHCVLCDDCIFKAVTTPYIYGDCVVWMRDIRYIKKLRAARTDALSREITGILSQHDF